MKFEGQNVWLIGASSGIGAALVPRLAAKGANLILSARREEELRQVADSVPSVRTLVKPLDVTDNEAVKRVYQEIATEWGPLAAMLYSAGQWEQGHVANFEAEAATRQGNVNYLGLMRVVGAVMPDMIARRGGTIVGMASIAGYGGAPGGAAYCSSKSGVITFLQTIRIELKQYDVDVVTLAPGYVKTAMTEKNTFEMPHLMELDDAADEIVKGLVKGDAEVHFPKPYSRFWKIWTALPRGFYESWMYGELKKGKYG